MRVNARTPYLLFLTVALPFALANAGDYHTNWPIHTSTPTPTAGQDSRRPRRPRDARKTREKRRPRLPPALRDDSRAPTSLIEGIDHVTADILQPGIFRTGSSDGDWTMQVETLKSQLPMKLAT